jgi:carbon storage regulator
MTARAVIRPYEKQTVFWPATMTQSPVALSRRNAVMLVLSRKIGEKLVIGDNITVVVSRVAGNRVTLGIEAPADVRIVRGELKNATDESAPAVRTFGVCKSGEDALVLSVPRLAK